MEGRWKMRLRGNRETGRGQMLCCEPGAGQSQPLHPREYATLAVEGGQSSFYEGSADVKSSTEFSINAFY